MTSDFPKLHYSRTRHGVNILNLVSSAFLKYAPLNALNLVYVHLFLAFGYCIVTEESDGFHEARAQTVHRIQFNDGV